MMGLNLDDIISAIKERKGLNEDDIKAKIQEKRDKLNGLVSEEGAAHIIANELGIDLLESVRKQGVKIQRLQAGMRVGIIGKVVKTYEIRSFNKGERSGRVASFLFGDETGLVRIVLWDENHIKQMEDGHIKEGVIIKIEQGNVKENNGYKEMHLGNYSNLTLNPEGVESVNVIQRSGQALSEPGDSSEVRLQRLDSANPGEFVTVYGTIVQVYDPRFYQGCSECGKKSEGKCASHPEAEVKQIPILNFFLDDGFGGMRATAFRDNVAKLFNIDNTDTLEANFEQLKGGILGTQRVITGKINKSDYTGNNEFMVTRFPEVDPKTLLSQLTI